jgi:nucleoid-associated protein YgaU
MADQVMSRRIALMTTTMQGNEMFAHMTGRAVEAFSMVAEANQKILRDLVDLSASTAKEGVRLYAELQSSAVEALKEGQDYLLRRQSEIQDAPRDPFAFYQKGVLESVEGAQKTFKIFEANAQAMTRSAERLQATAEQTGKEIQATFAQVTGKVKSIYSPLD